MSHFSIKSNNALIEVFLTSGEKISSLSILLCYEYPFTTRRALNFSSSFFIYCKFSLEHPLKIDGPFPIRKLNKLPCLFFLQGLNFLNHCTDPLIFIMARYILSKGGEVSKSSKKCICCQVLIPISFSWLFWMLLSMYKSIITMNPLFLWVHLCYKMSLKLSPIFFYYCWFSLEYPFITDEPFPIRMLNKLSCLIFLQRHHLLHHWTHPLIFLLASYSLLKGKMVSKTSKKCIGCQIFIPKFFWWLCWTLLSTYKNIIF